MYIVTYKHLKLEVEGEEPPLGESMVADFEKHIGFSLPQDYRNFLIKTNGGIPDRSTLTSKAFIDYLRQTGGEVIKECYDDYSLGISCFCGFGDKRYDIVKNNQPYFDHVESGYLMIAEGGGDLPIYLCAKGEDTGKVYFVYDPLFLEEEPEEFKVGRLLADNFNDMLDASLTDIQFQARFDSIPFITEKLDRKKYYLPIYKENKNYEGMVSLLLNISIYSIFLEGFNEVESFFKQAVSVYEETGEGDLQYIDSANLLDYAKLAQEEKAAGRSDWHIRFADRLSFIDPDNNPYPYPG